MFTCGKISHEILFLVRWCGPITLERLSPLILKAALSAMIPWMNNMQKPALEFEPTELVKSWAMKPGHSITVY